MIWVRCDKDSCWLSDCAKCGVMIGTGAHRPFQSEAGTPYHEGCVPENQSETTG